MQTSAVRIKAFDFDQAKQTSNIGQLTQLALKLIGNYKPKVDQRKVVLTDARLRAVQLQALNNLFVFHMPETY